MKSTAPALSLSKPQLVSLFSLTIVTLGIIATMQFLQGIADDDAFGPLDTLTLIAFEALIAMTASMMFARFGETNRQAIKISLLGVLLAMLAIWLFDFDDLAPHGFDLIVDLVNASLWLACGVLLIRLVGVTDGSREARQFMFAGLAMLVLWGGLEIADEFIGPLGALAPLYQTMAGSTEAAVLLLYAFGLLSALCGRSIADRDAVPLGAALSRALFKAEFSTVGATASILYNRTQFALWRFVNPGKTFGDFYAWQITRKLDRGRAHRTLGGKAFASDNLFGEADTMTPAQFALRKPGLMNEVLFSQGLRPEHTVVDYGCGSLRVGNRLIRFLDKGKYIGLDVTDRFFNDGLALLGADIIALKAPTCSVISEQSLTATRAAKPDFVFSEAVLKHIPGEFLDDYFDKLCSLAGPHTRLLVSFTESATERQISGKSWTWSIPRVEALLAARLPHARIEVVHLTDEASQRNGVHTRGCVIAALPPEA